MQDAICCRAQILAAGQAIIEKSLTWGASGNISLRNGEQIFITASGTLMGALAEEDILLVGEPCGKKPSKELEMHQAIYQKRPDVNAVIHASPFYTTLCASSTLVPECNLFIEAMYYCARRAYVDYFHAGSEALAKAVETACQQADVIFMRNHGVIVCAENMKEALCALEIVENVCKMNVVTNAGKFSLTPVASATVEDFLIGGYYKPKRK